MAIAPATARPRPGGGRLFIVVGLILAVGAGVLVFFLGNVVGGGGVGGTKVTVVVAATSISLRSPIVKSDLTTEQFSGTFTNVYSRTDDVAGLIAEVNISKGAIITSDMLARDALGALLTSSNAPTYLPLASGFVALTIPTSEQQGVAGHITVGDYITAIASLQGTTFVAPGPSNSGSALLSKTVFTNIRVIGVGPAQISVQPASGGSGGTTSTGTVGGVSSSLTIEMTQCDAEYMVWFLGTAQMKYTLESSQDYQPAPTQADPTCPTVLAAKGVTVKDVNTRYHFA